MTPTLTHILTVSILEAERERKSMKKTTLWQAALTVGIAALATPAFAQSQTSPGGSSPGSMKSPHSDSGTMGSGGTSGMTGSSRTMGSPDTPSSGSMNPAGRPSSAMTDQGKTEADRTLNQNIRQALSADSALGSSAKSVHFSTDNGKVTLHGTVATEKEKKDIEAKVEKLSGVKDVDNQLQIGPASSSSAADSMGTTGSAKSSEKGAMDSPSAKSSEKGAMDSPSASARP
jgi:BON domain